MDNSNSPAIQCSKAWCKQQLLPDAKYKICDHCRERDRQTKRAERARNAEKRNKDTRVVGKKSKRPQEDVVGDERAHIRQRTNSKEPGHPHASEDEDESSNPIEVSNRHQGEGIGTLTIEILQIFDEGEDLFDSLRSEFRTRSDVVFKGAYEAPDDPLVHAKQQVEMAAQEVWRITGYRFTSVTHIPAIPVQHLSNNRVKDHKTQKLGHRTRFWCSQDKAHKKKSKILEGPNVRNRDNVGMKRYPCRSRLIISCRANAARGKRTITIQLEHHTKHVQYVDVSMPPGAAKMIREHVEWLTPVAMVAKVQAAYAGVNAAQIHRAWMDMSQLFWRRDDLQLPSAKKLLEEFTDMVDIFSPKAIPDGVEILCWGMKKIATPLKGKIVEVGIDATCK